MTPTPGSGLAAIAATLLLALAASSAYARPVALNDFADAAESRSSAHFKVHYDTAVSSASFADDVLDALELSYPRLVASAGGSPNAGLRDPVSDAGNVNGSVRSEDRDDLVDVFIQDLPPNTRGTSGCDGGEQNGTNSGYMTLNADLDGHAHLRAVAAHEFVHVIQCAYASRYDLFGTPYYTGGRSAKGFLTESTANWAMEFLGLGPVTANTFGFPEVPLDCTYRDWEGQPCGVGYGRWLFIQHLTENHGIDLVADALERLDDLCPVRCNDDTGDHGVPHFDALAAELEQRTGGTVTVGDAFRAYAHDVWDESAWASPAVGEIARKPRVTYHRLSAQDPDSGQVGRAVDHLAATYERFRLGAARPGDRLELEVQVPAEVDAAPTLLHGVSDGDPQRIPMGPPESTNAASRTYRHVLDVDGSNDVVVPLVNDSGDDDLQFALRGVLVRTSSDATPPEQTNVTTPPFDFSWPAPAGEEFDGARADRAVGLKLKRGRRLKLKRRRVKIKVKCPAREQNGPCRGKLKLKSRTKLAITKRGKTRKRRPTLAAARFRVPTGQTARVKLKVRRRVWLAIGKRRKLRAAAVAGVRDSAGNRTRVKRTYKLKNADRKRLRRKLRTR